MGNAMNVQDALEWADHCITVKSDPETPTTDEALSVLAAEVRRLRQKLDAAEAAARSEGRYIIPNGYAQ